MFVPKAKILFDDKHPTIRDYQVAAIEFWTSKTEVSVLSPNPGMGKTYILDIQPLKKG